MALLLCEIGRVVNVIGHQFLVLKEVCLGEEY